MMNLIATDIEYFLKTIHQQQIMSFGQQLQFEYKSKRISYQIPFQDKAFLLEGQYGAALSFCNLCFEDALFLFFAILLEVNLVFVSHNITLLTATL